MTGFNNASWSRTSKRAALVSDAGLVLPFSDVIKFAIVAHTENPGHYFYELFVLADTRPRVLATVHGGFWENCLRFST